jgi:glycosyltransferase involved in cell wall biosynthesis
MKITAVAPFPKYKDGIPRVAEELISKLCEANSVESISIITRESNAFVDPSLSRNKKVSLFTQRSFLLPQTLLKIIELYRNSDVFLLFAHPCYVFDPFQPLCYFQLLIKCRVLPRAKMIQMLYDFANYACPEDHVASSKWTKLNSAWKNYFSKIPIRYVAISESTKKQAIHYWGLKAANITVIYLSSFILPKTPRVNFGSKKILIVSDISPRKNHLRLIKAFELVHRSNPSNDAELIIAGHLRKDIPEFESTLSDIRRRNKGIKITLAGYLTDSELRSLYEEADVFIYPSLYEGFGLPVLEAMASGCPVIASNVSSLPEVVGDAGLLVDPRDVEALAHAMSTVLKNDELKREMSRKSIAQAQKFSWEKAGAELLAVCREVAAIARLPRDRLI